MFHEVKRRAATIGLIAGAVTATGLEVFAAMHDLEEAGQTKILDGVI
ncbi:hypothetical protein [Bradyrhizobium sp.]